MLKSIIIIEDEDGLIAVYSDLKKCCDANPNFCYNYIRNRELPCNYKGFYFQRLGLNVGNNSY